MTGNDLVLSGTRADYGQSGLPVVLLQFNGHGSKQFERITKSEANAGQTAYDLAGRLVSRDGTLFQSVLPAAVTSATYDLANRLTARSAAGVTASATWDACGT